MKLNQDILKSEAISFCQIQNKLNHPDLVGINDKKSIGEYIKHKFKDFLKNKYDFDYNSSSKWIYFLDSEINTDINLTYIKQPHSSLPFKNARQKVYGLGHNLLVFVCDKQDNDNECYINFKHCTFIESSKTSDYTLTRRLREMIEDDAIKEDIISFLMDRNLPGDEIIFSNLADEILKNPPEQGYLTIFNALQWKILNINNYDWQW